VRQFRIITKARVNRSATSVALVCSLVALSGCSNDGVFVGRATDLPEVATPSPTTTPAVPTHAGVGRIYAIKVGGVTRTYRLHLPLSGPTGPRPLVIALHAGGSSAKALTGESGLDGAGDRSGVVVAYPQGVRGFWNNGLPGNLARTNAAADVAFVGALIQDASTHTRIDQKRVVVAGIGDGAIMALRIAADAPQLVTGAVAIEGGLVDATGAPRPREPISVLFIRATSDPSLPYTGSGEGSSQGPQLGANESADVFRAINGLGGSPTESDVRVSDRDPADGARTFRTRWLRGARGTSVTLYRIEGAGGAWPGGTGESARSGSIGSLTRDFSAASIAIQFALETRRP